MRSLAKSYLECEIPFQNHLYTSNSSFLADGSSAIVSCEPIGFELKALKLIKFISELRYFEHSQDKYS